MVVYIRSGIWFKRINSFSLTIEQNSAIKLEEVTIFSKYLSSFSKFDFMLKKNIEVVIIKIRTTNTPKTVIFCIKGG
jgi:ribosomal protein S26